MVRHYRYDLVATVSSLITATTWLGLVSFLTVVTVVAVRSFTQLFWQRQGWSHRLCGGLLLTWLLVGGFATTTTWPGQHQYNASVFFVYDLVLGCLGIVTTLSAARDFPHATVHNPASGTLSPHALVTRAEMLEHVFYQGLNLWQALYLHAVHAKSWSIVQRLGLLYVATAPWHCRHCFPVHSFSDNWQKTTTVTSMATNNDRVDHRAEILLYRIKKWQYVLQKHVILHGWNITACWWQYQHDAPTQPTWRVFWLCLNTAYAMEFFLQTLVRRNVWSQSTMLAANRALMLVSSVAAPQAVWGQVSWGASALSLCLNWHHRHHDVINTMLVALAGVVYLPAVQEQILQWR